MTYTIACEKGVDVVIISEPNKKIAQEYQYITDRRVDVAIYIRNKDIGIISYEIGDGYVCLQWQEWCLYGCYCSPNIPLGDYEAYVDTLMRSVKSKNVSAVIAGDFNAKAPLWGSPVLDKRGTYLMEWAAELNLSVVNVGDTPTFERGESASFIDITWATSDMMRHVGGWKVLQGEFYTYHNPIYFEVERGASKVKERNGVYRFLDKARFAQELKNHFRGRTHEVNPESFSSTLEKMSRRCTVCIPRFAGAFPYWFDDVIYKKRLECNRLRRRWTRKNRSQKNELSQTNEKIVYKQAKKELKKLILESKKRHWKELQNDLENDIWGDGFRVTMRHLGSLPPPYNPTPQRKLAIIRDLFPIKDDSFKKTNTKEDRIDLITNEELLQAVSRIKLGKAPGPDHLTAEAVRIIAEEIPDVLLKVLNTLLLQQSFPAKWKEATVVLLWKGKPMDSSSAFRPICLISILGKLYERVIKCRLEQELNRNGGLSNMQFGFVKGKSAVHAIRTVVEKVKTTKTKWVAAVSLDIKNAFNTASWSKILGELTRRNVSKYLKNIIEDYFSHRKIVLDRKTKLDVNAGVPQGSVLGPTLWNILYDGVLDLEYEDEITIVAYADDLMVIVGAEDARQLMFRTNESLEKISTWMDRNDLEIAPQKSEAVILKGPRKWNNIHFELLDKKIYPKKCLKYLGVYMDYKLTFGPHVTHAIGRAETSLSALMKIMPNVGGPSNRKREVLYGVVQSKLLYAIPAWVTALDLKKHRVSLGQLQRRTLLRVISGYRTISANATQVIAGVPPISLIADEQRRVFLVEKEQSSMAHKRKQQREVTLKNWQRQWSGTVAAGAWTRTLIPDLVPWVKCGFRRVDYFLTQFLSGHGHFRAYLKRFGLADEDACLYCGEVDTPEHAVLNCERWGRERQILETQVGRPLSKDNMVSVMIEKESNFKYIRDYVAKILSTRESEQRNR